MAITTPEPEAAIAVRVGRRGVTDLGGTEPWRPRILATAGPAARVALVQSRASLLGGDEVSLEVVVDEGCALELVELGATVAHHVRGGAPARVSAVVRLGRGARLVWLAEPLIAAAGCRVARSVRVELAAGAVVLLRETLVLGRAGEEPGRASSHTRITLEGRPVVDETLETRPSWLLRSSVVAGPAGTVDAVTLAGLRDPSPPPGALQCHEPATLWRGLGAAGAPLAAAGGELARRWLALLLEHAA
ncbi:MAG: urease accessory protein UreD [Solirubrobacteraceae bacterium]